MDKPYDSLDQHFNLPHIRSIGTDRPVQWLRMGWADMRDNLGASLSYGVILAAIGYTILSYAADKPYLFMAAISGFMLIGPLAAAGMYEISRRHEKGERVSFIGSIRGLARNADSLAFLTIDGLYRALGEAERKQDAPQYCDACFTGDYPTRLTDQEEVEVPDQLSLLAERVI